MFARIFGNSENTNQEEEEECNNFQEINKRKQQKELSTSSNKLSTTPLLIRTALHNEEQQQEEELEQLLLTERSSSSTSSFCEELHEQEKFSVKVENKPKAPMTSHHHHHHNQHHHQQQRQEKIEEQQVYKINTPHLSQRMCNPLYTSNDMDANDENSDVIENNKWELQRANQQQQQQEQQQSNIPFTRMGTAPAPAPAAAAAAAEVYNVDDTNSISNSFSAEGTSNTNDSNFASCDDGEDDDDDTNSLKEEEAVGTAIVKSVKMNSNTDYVHGANVPNNTNTINKNNNNNLEHDNNDDEGDDDDSSCDSDSSQTSSTDDSELYCHPTDRVRFPFQQSQATKTKPVSTKGDNVHVREPQKWIDKSRTGMPSNNEVYEVEDDEITEQSNVQRVENKKEKKVNRQDNRVTGAAHLYIAEENTYINKNECRKESQEQREKTVEEHEQEEEQEQEQKRKEKLKEEELKEQLALMRAPIDTVGLINDGSTCYLNSLLQLLFHINYFRTALYKIPVQVPHHDNKEESEMTNTNNNNNTTSCRMSSPVTSSAITTTSTATTSVTTSSQGNNESDEKNTNDTVPGALGTIHGALQELFVEMTERTNAASTRKLTLAFGWGERELTEQHDIQEMAALLRENLEEKMKNTVTEGVINELFEGRGESVVETLDGSYVSKRSDVFCDIHLPLGEHTTLIESLQSLTSREQLTGDNKYLVEAEDGKKGVYKDAEKYYTFKKFPPVIWFHLKRFAIDLTSPRLESKKVNSRLEFPVELDLTDLEKQENDDNNSEDDNNANEEEEEEEEEVKKVLSAVENKMKSEICKEHATDKQKEKLSSSLRTVNTLGTKSKSKTPFTRHSPAIYDLHGVIVHRGTVRSGHYYCYIREYNAQQSKFTRWIEFEDENVRVVSEEVAVESNFGGGRLNRQMAGNNNNNNMEPMLTDMNDYMNSDPFHHGNVLNNNNNNNNNNNESNSSNNNSNASAYMLSYVRRSDTPTILAPFDSRVISPYIRNYVKHALEEEARKKREEEEMRAKITFIVVTDSSLESYCAEHQLELFTHNLMEAKNYATCVLEMKKTDLIIDLYKSLMSQSALLPSLEPEEEEKKKKQELQTLHKNDSQESNNDKGDNVDKKTTTSTNVEPTSYLKWRIWRSPSSRATKWLPLDSHESCVQMYTIYEKEQQVSKGPNAAQPHQTRHNTNTSSNDNNYPEEITIRRWLKNEEQSRPLELLLYIQTKPILFRPYSVYKNFIHDEHLFTTVDLPQPVLTTGMGVYFQQTHITGCNLDLLLYVMNRNEPLRANRYMPVEDGLMYLRLPSPFYVRKVKLRCTISGVLSINRIRVDLAACTLPSKLLHCNTSAPLSQYQSLEEENEEEQQSKGNKEIKASSSSITAKKAENDSTLRDLASTTELFAPFPKTVVDVTEENVWNAMLLFWKYYDARERKMKYLGSTLVDSRSVPRCCEMILAQMSGILPEIAQIQQQEMEVRLQKKHKPSAKKKKSKNYKNRKNDADADSDSNEEKDERKTSNKTQKSKTTGSNSDNEEEEKKGRTDSDEDNNSNSDEDDDDDDEHSIDNDLRFHVANEMNDNWEFYEERNNALTQCTNNTTLRFQDTKFSSGSCIVVEYVGKLPSPTSSSSSSLFTNEEGSVVKYYKEIASMIKVIVTQMKRMVHDHHVDVAHMMNTYYTHYTIQTSKNSNNTNLTSNEKQININNDENHNKITKINAPAMDTTNISTETNSLTNTVITNTSSYASNLDCKNDESCNAELHKTPNSTTITSTNPFSTTLPTLHTREFNAVASNVCFMSKHLNYNSVCNKIASAFNVNAENILLYPCSSHMDDVEPNESNLSTIKSSPTSGTAPGVLSSSNNNNNSGTSANNKWTSANNYEDRFNSFVSPSQEAFSVSFTEMDNVLGKLVDYNHTFTHHNRLFFEVLPISREKYLQYAPLTLTLRDAAGHALLKERFNITEKLCSLSGVVHSVLECAKREIHPRPVMSSSEQVYHSNKRKTSNSNKVDKNSKNANKKSNIHIEDDEEEESNVLYDPWNSLQETLSSRHFLLLMIEPHAHVYRTLREVEYNPALLPSSQNKHSTSHLNVAQGTGGSGGNNSRPNQTLQQMQATSGNVSLSSKQASKQPEEHKDYKNNSERMGAEKEVDEENNTSNSSNAEEDVEREAAASRAQSANREAGELNHPQQNTIQDNTHNNNNNNNCEITTQTSSFDRDIVLMSDDEDDDADSDNDSDDFELRESRYRDKVELQNFALQGFEFELIPAEPLKSGEQRITCCQGEVVTGHEVKIFGNPFFITINERTTVTDAMELMLQRTHCSPSVLVDNPKLKVMMYTNIGKHFNEWNEYLHLFWRYTVNETRYLRNLMLNYAPAKDKQQTQKTEHHADPKLRIANREKT